MSRPEFAWPEDEAAMAKVRQALPKGWRLDRGTHCIYLYNPALDLPMRPVTAKAWRQLESFAERVELELFDLFDDLRP